MAHWEQAEFIRRVKSSFPDSFQSRQVMEVGSGEIRGTVRSQFDDCDYLGVDVATGPGVDRVCPGQTVDEPSESFDVVISCECFEHNPYWLETFVNMLRLLKPGGLCIVSCALTGRQEHGTSRMNPAATLADSEDYIDYYRNLTQYSFSKKIDLSLHFKDYFFKHNIYHKDLYFVGIKQGDVAQDDIQKLTELAHRVGRIRGEKTRLPIGIITGHIDYALKFILTRLLSERGYHNGKYAVRQGLARLLELVVGKERVQNYRQKKRERKMRRKGLL